jgi:thiol-disulfide isomerase/thioredoxin
MRLERDEFVIEYDATQIDGKGLIAIIKKAGYESSIVSDSESPIVADGDSGSREDPIFVEALARAKKENKPLVVDFYADWCGPCLKMLKTTFPDPEVAALLKKCVFLKVDTDEHPELAKSFGVVGLPDTRFFALGGSEVSRFQDYMDAQTFAGELRKLLKESAAEKGK